MVTTTSIQEITLPLAASLGSANGTLFSTLQATTHAWQPVHLSRSIAIPQRGMMFALCFLESDSRRSSCSEASEMVILTCSDLHRIHPDPLGPTPIGAVAEVGGNAHHLGHCSWSEPRPHLDFADRGFQPDQGAITDLELPRCLRIDLDPGLPAYADVRTEYF